MLGNACNPPSSIRSRHRSKSRRAAQSQCSTLPLGSERERRMRPNWIRPVLLLSFFFRSAVSGLSRSRVSRLVPHRSTVEVFLAGAFGPFLSAFWHLLVPSPRRPASGPARGFLTGWTPGKPAVPTHFAQSISTLRNANCRTTSRHFSYLSQSNSSH